MNLAGRVAIVTGAAYGIGYATAERFVKEGAAVVVSDIKGHEAAAAKLQMLSDKVISIRADVASDDSVAQLVAGAMDRFGSVDILVNNAAVSTELKPSAFEEESVEDWRRIYDVNVIGVFRTCRAVSPHMRKQKWGRIINIASGTAFKGSPGMMHYIASKGAIISMTRSLATEFGKDNVLVNAVSPGFTMTESVRAAAYLSEPFSAQAIATRVIKREAVAVDVANAIYFFASTDSAFITGQTLTADGGSVFH